MKQKTILLIGFILACLGTYAQLPALNPALCATTVNDNFTYTQNGATVTFSNTTQYTGGSSYTWATVWNFGDGGTASTVSATRTYAAPGTYTVRMINRVNGLFPNTDYCYDTVVKQITISTYPCSVNNADYTHSEDHRTATFVNTSLENSQFTYTYLWRFGDGNTSALRNPVYTYAADGTYTVRLIQTATNTVDNNVVCVDSQSYSVTAKDWCAALNPQIQVNIQNGAYVRLKLNTASVGFTTLNASWNLGDPTTLTDTATSVYVFPYVEYNYPYNGTFNPTANVTAIRPGSSACQYNLSGQLTITGYERCDSLQAAFTETVEANNVTFTNTSAQAFVQPTYFWDFGDGLLGRSHDTTHTYAYLGNYTVTYIMYYPNYLHCADTLIKQINVSSYTYPALQNGLTTISDGYLKYDSTAYVLEQTPFQNTALPQKSATYEFWYFNCEQLIQDAKIFRTNTNSPYFGVGKIYDGSSLTELNEVTFFSDHPSAGSAGQRTLPNLNNNAWHHLAVEIYKVPNSQRCGGNSGDLGQANFYYDGIYMATSSVNNMCADLSFMHLNLWPSLYIDEFMVTKGLKYNRNNFVPNLNNLTTPDTNVVALYHFNAGIDSVLANRSVFFNSANNTFDLSSTTQSVPGYTAVNARVATGADNLISTAHGHAHKDSVCVGDTIVFSAVGNVFVNAVNGIQLVTTNRAVAVTPDTTITIAAYFVDSFTCLQMFDTLQLYIFPLPIVTAGTDTFICAGDTVQLNASGGGTYYWNSSNELSSNTISSPLAYPVNSRNFICTITDTNGCRAKDTVLVEVKSLPPITIDLQNTDTLLCNNQVAAFIIDSTNTGVGILQWSIPNVITSSTYSTYYQPDSSLLIIAVLTDSNQCHSADSVFVHVLASPTYVSAPADTAICYGSSLQLIAQSNAQINLWNGLPDSVIVTAFNPANYVLQGTNNYSFNYAPFSISCQLTDTFFLNVQSLPHIPVIADTTICTGNSVAFYIPGTNTVQWNNNYANGQTIYPSNNRVFIAAVTDTNFCTAYDTVLLTVNSSFRDTLNIQICPGSSYLAGGNLQTTSGTYYDTLTSVTGCDSIIVTQLLVNTLPVSAINASVCAGSYYLFAGQQITVAGTYTDTVTNPLGCDSVIILNLTINATTYGYENAAICMGQTYPFGGQNLSVAGVYNDTLTAQSGCDSIVALTLTVNTLPQISLLLPDSLCTTAAPVTLTGTPAGGSYIGTGLSGNTFNPATALSGLNYITYSYTDSNGCASLTTDTILVTACTDTNCHAYYTLFPDTTLPHHWFALNQATGMPPLTYLWNWGDNTSTPGATPSHTYNSPAHYNVCLSIQDANGCADTYCDSSTYIYKTDEDIIEINCVTELPNGITTTTADAAITLYPNPASDMLFISADNVTIKQVDIYTAEGVLVSHTNTYHNPAINISKLAVGFYVAIIKTNHETIIKKWVKI
jgi:PKD repeat protein